MSRFLDWLDNLGDAGTVVQKDGAASRGGPASDPVVYLREAKRRIKRMSRESEPTEYLIALRTERMRWHGVAARSRDSGNMSLSASAKNFCTVLDREIARVESSSGIGGVDPLENPSLEDFDIVVRHADGDELLPSQHSRRKWLRHASKIYRPISWGDTNQAQQLILKWLEDADLIRRLELEAEETWPGFLNLGRFGGDHVDQRQLVEGVSERIAPSERLIRSPHDAELTAADWMRHWGFSDAAATPVGADEGIDVNSSDAVAQVKALMVPVGRPDLQNLAGVAAVEGKKALFFALCGYTSQAISWAEKAEIALFRFDLQGRPEAVNALAASYLAGSHE